MLPPDASQWTQMRQEIMVSLRAELQNDLQSQVHQLVQECKILHKTNSELKRKVAWLEKEVGALKNPIRVERRAKYQEAVHKNKDWIYPVSIPTVGKLMSVGYDIEESQDIIDNIEIIEYSTMVMRRGDAVISPSSIDIDVIHYQTSDYDGYLPHFQVFSNALIDYEHTISYMETKDTVFRFSIENSIPRNCLDILQVALQHTHFHELRFGSNGFDGFSNLEFIANCVRANTRLRKLRLQDINFDNSSQYNVLLAAVKSNDSLQELELSYYYLSEGGVLRETLTNLKWVWARKLKLNHHSMANLRPTDMS
eukprot:scaffold52200_cov37-Cyclotella_meneghiniana.AAC.3